MEKYRHFLLLTLPVFLILQATQLQQVSGEGTISIRFSRYLNPKGLGKNGHCCDGRWGMCSTDCDPFFVICIDEVNSPNTTAPCKYNKTETAPIENQNSIDFTNLTDVGGITNPMVFEMMPLSTDVAIKVAVYDKDSGSNDDIDFLRVDLGFRPYDIKVGQKRLLNITHRTTLEVEVLFSCLPDWYGPRCSELCREPDTDEHYTCNPKNGEKVCKLGWEGPLCSTMTSTCTSDSCQNWGTCTFRGRKEHCTCLGEFSGDRCEIDECDDTCDPGRCRRDSPGLSGYTCICPQGYEAVQPPGRGTQCQWMVRPGPRPDEATPRPTPRPNEATPNPWPRPDEATARPWPRPDEATPRPTPRPNEATARPRPRPDEATARPWPRPDEATARPWPRPDEATARPWPRPDEATARPWPGPATSRPGRPYPGDNRLPDPAPSRRTDIVDCDTIKTKSYRNTDGVYKLKLGSNMYEALVYCDMTSGGGWTYIQHRGNGLESFDRPWSAYKEGFGDPGPNSDHWIGLEAMHLITNQRRYKLKVELVVANGSKFEAEYEDFKVDSEIYSYRLHVSGYKRPIGYTDRVGDALGLTGIATSGSHDNMRFSTYDRDNDRYARNCGRDFRSGWWFNNCFATNLNGMYKREYRSWDPTPCDQDRCIQWRTLSGYMEFSLKEVTMKILPHY